MVRNTVRSLLAEPRPAQPQRRDWIDWAPVVALLVSAVVEIPLRETVTWWPGSAPLVAVLALCLLLRRSRPLAVVLVMFGFVSAMSVAQLLGVDTSSAEPYAAAWVLLLPYALLRWGAGSEIAIGVAVLLVSGALGVAASYEGPGEAVGGMVVLLFPAALGASIRYRGTARRREIDQVKLREREQLARELHDTVAHHVSAIAIQAQAGRAVAATSPDRAVEALGVIEQAASRTLAEMRAMVGILRDGDEAVLAPQPGVSDIPSLAGTDGALPRVEVTLTGDLDDLSPPIDAAVYRLAQESITNAVRHARNATRIDVRVEGDEQRVHLTVRDDGGTRPADRTSWVGYGLIGMAERAELLGGTLEAGPGAEGGWTVRAVLPRTGAVG